jgi:hypothetical protein
LVIPIKKRSGIGWVVMNRQIVHHAIIRPAGLGRSGCNLAFVRGAILFPAMSRPPTDGSFQSYYAGFFCISFNQSINLTLIFFDKIRSKTF